VGSVYDRAVFPEINEIRAVISNASRCDAYDRAYSPPHRVILAE